MAYMIGKNNALVPVIFPSDVLPALNVLASNDVRAKANVSKKTPYLFPSTRQSEFHLSGWHGFNEICKKVDLEKRENITFTKNRHLVSTLCSVMELPDNQRQEFYDHMGHSEHMNKTRYQCPRSINAVTKVVPVLNDIDGSKDDELAELSDESNGRKKDLKTLPTVNLDRKRKLDFLETTPNKKKYKDGVLKVVLKENTPIKEYKLRERKQVIDTQENADIFNQSSDEESSVDEGTGYDSKESFESESSSVDETPKRKDKQTNKNLIRKSKENIKSSRNYFKWTPISNLNFNDVFAGFINGSEKDWPSKEVQEDFIDRCGGRFNLYTLRTKLNNERIKYRNRQQRRKQEMNIP